MHFLNRVKSDWQLRLFVVAVLAFLITNSLDIISTVLNAAFVHGINLADGHVLKSNEENGFVINPHTMGLNINSMWVVKAIYTIFQFGLFSLFLGVAGRSWALAAIPFCWGAGTLIPIIATNFSILRFFLKWQTS